MADYRIKQNDTGPAIAAILKDGDKAVVDLTGATVRFHLKRNGTIKVDAAATIDDAGAGEVSYAWQAADTDEAGPHFCEFEVTFADGRIETFPNDSDVPVLVSPDIA